MTTNTLYSKRDPVIILDDGSFVGENMKISLKHMKNPGILKVYANWCPACQSKVKDINNLASILKKQNVSIYVIEAADLNPIFANHYSNKIGFYPTFLKVYKDGTIGDMIADKEGNPPGSVIDIVKILCKKS